MNEHKAVRAYLWVFAALMALLVLTVGASYIPYPAGLRWLGIFVALAIATVKMVLVVLYFMHLRDSSLVTQVFAWAALLWLLILFGLTVSDYLSRAWLPVSRGWTENASPRDS